MLAVSPHPNCALQSAPWTLAQTLDTLRQRRLVLIDTSNGLRVKHQHRHDLPGLADALAAYAEPLRLWLRLGGSEARTPAPWTAVAWDPATRLFAAWFGLEFVMPTVPASLHPGEVIRDWVRFRASVIDRLALGPMDPGADRLRAELAALYVRFGRSSIRPARPALPMAA